MGPTFPLSDFGDDDRTDYDSGLAGVGFCLGITYLYPINDKGLDLYFGADFDYNGLKSSVKDDYENEIGSGADIKFFKYINVPFMAGLNYTIKANDKISMFTNFGFGPDFMKVTNMKIEANNRKVELNIKSSANFAYKIGGGLLVNDKLILGLNYSGLGEHNLNAEMKYDGGIGFFDDQKLKVCLLTFSVGIKLK